MLSAQCSNAYKSVISKANFFKQGKYHLGVPQFPGSCFKIKLVSVTVDENIWKIS